MDPITIALGLTKVVPSIVGLFKGRDAEKKAEGIITIAKQVTGIEDPREAVDTIAGNPELLLQFKSKTMDHLLEMRKVDLEEDRMYLSDRQGARAADVEKTKATGSRDINLYVLAWVVTAGFFTLVGILIFKQIPEGNETARVALPMLFGALISGFKDVLGYFFGSSKGSSEKTALLARK